MATYNVQPGDTLYKIWETYGKPNGIGWDQFQTLNPGLSFGWDSVINIGDSINIGESIPEDVIADNPNIDGDGVPTEESEDPRLTARPELMADPAYNAFMQQFGFDIATSEATLQSTYDRLLANATRQFGAWSGPMVTEDNPMTEENESVYGVMDEGEVREATKSELLGHTSREGGLYDVQYDDLIDQNLMKFAGSGMAFGGGRKKEQMKIMRDRDFDKLGTGQGYLEGYSQAQMLNRREEDAYVKAKLKEEAAAAQRLSAETV